MNLHNHQMIRKTIDYDQGAYNSNMQNNLLSIKGSVSHKNIDLKTFHNKEYSTTDKIYSNDSLSKRKFHKNKEQLKNPSILVHPSSKKINSDCQNLLNLIKIDNRPSINCLHQQDSEYCKIAQSLFFDSKNHITERENKEKSKKQEKQISIVQLHGAEGLNTTYSNQFSNQHNQKQYILIEKMRFQMMKNQSQFLKKQNVRLASENKYLEESVKQLRKQLNIRYVHTANVTKMNKFIQSQKNDHIPKFLKRKNNKSKAKDLESLIETISSAEKENTQVLSIKLRPQIFLQQFKSDRKILQNKENINPQPDFQSNTSRNHLILENRPKKINEYHNLNLETKNKFRQIVSHNNLKTRTKVKTQWQSISPIKNAQFLN